MSRNKTSSPYTHECIHELEKGSLGRSVGGAFNVTGVRVGVSAKL